MTRQSEAFDLEDGVFKKGSPRQIARSLKRSAESSTRRKTSQYRSAMSMLTFYINRAGKILNSKTEAPAGGGERSAKEGIWKRVAPSSGIQLASHLADDEIGCSRIS